MLVKSWRFLTIILAALTMGMAWAHALELPAKMGLGAEDWFTVQQIYGAFGRIGAVIEVGSILVAAVLSYLVRQRRPAFGFTLAGAGLLAAALAVWFAFVAPMNAELAMWSTAGIPTDWMRVRDQWEYAHAARFVLQLAGLGALMVSVIVETPDEPVRER